MADMLTALNGGYGKYFKDMIPDGVSNAYNKMSSPEGLDALSRGNMLTQLIGAGIQGGQAIANYDYPKDALGWAALPAQAVTGMAKGVINQIGGTMEEAPGAAMGWNDGKENTNLGLSMLGVGGVLSNAPRGALGANVWQGGPHKYGPEGAAKSMDHIGKGEGAHAPVDRAATVINNSSADAAAMRDLERRVYDLTSADDFINYGQQTGNKISTPFQVGGPKMTVDEIQKMEAAKKFTPASEGYYDPKTFTPEDFEIGSYVIPNPGDPTIAGALQESLSGKSNVINQSGTDFMRQMPTDGANPPIWASGDRVMNTLQSKGIEAKDNPAYFVSNEQGPKSVPFNSVVAQRYEELLDPSAISSKGAQEIKNFLERRVKNAETGKLAPIKEWQKNIPAANSPEFAKWLHNLPGTTKSEVVLRLNTGKAINEGAPDVREIIHSFIGDDAAWSIDRDKMISALTSNKSVSGLIGDPLVGKSIARVDQGVPLRPSSNPSFPIETTGEYVGGFGFRPRRSDVWRDWYSEGNFANRPPNAGHRAFTLSYPVQKVDREWQDTLMKLREDAIRQK